MYKHNLLPMQKTCDLIEKQGYGSLTAIYEVFQGKIVAIINNQFDKKKFAENNNAEAVASLLAEIKSLNEKKTNGMFNVSLKFTNGDVREVYIQRTIRENYVLQKEILEDKVNN